MFGCPHTFRYPCTPVCSHASLYICMFWGYLHVIWGWGHLYNPYVGVWGASAHWWGILVPISISVILSQWVASYWTGYLDVCYASCCSTFLCSFHYVSSLYYHSYDYYSSGDWCLLVCHLFISYCGPSLFGLPAMLGQCDVVLPPLLTPWCPGGGIGLASVPQQQPPPSLMPLQSYANYAIGSLQVGSLSELSFHLFCILYVWCLFWCLLSTFRCHAGCHFHPGGSTIEVCTTATPWSLLMLGICATWWWVSAHTRYAQSGCSLHYLE